jgi:hypothetical protein
VTGKHDGSARVRIGSTGTRGSGATSTGRVRRTALGLAGVTVAAGTIMILSANGAGAAPAAPAQAAAAKVTLCHRTDSETNPYVQIRVAAAAAYNGHYKEHKGDVWFPGHPKKPHWGDIIPPFVYKGTTYSWNWNAAGQAIFNNGCKPVTNTTSSAASSTAASSTAASSTAASSTAASSTAASSTAASSTSSSLGISGEATSSGASSASSSGSLGVLPTSATSPPIPGGVSAGLHTPLGNAGLKAWGIVLMLVGGAAGLIAGLWPTRRRAH